MKYSKKVPRTGEKRDEYIKKLNTLNEYDRLVENLSCGEFDLKHLEAAYSESLRRSKYIPEGVWNILTNNFDINYIGTLHPLWTAIGLIVGAAELSYRRGIQEGEESKNDVI